MHLVSRLVAVGRLLFLAPLSLAASVVLLVLSAVSIALVPLGVGAMATPAVLAGVRRHAAWRSRVAGTWAGVTVPVRYRSHREFQGGPVGQVQRCAWALGDRQTWRNLRWLLVDAVAGFVLAVLPALLIAHGLFGPVLTAGLWRTLNDHGDSVRWFAGFPVTSQLLAVAAGAAGLAMVATGLWLSTPALRLHALLTRSQLAPGHRRDLERRVEQLTESRSEALDTSAAELRRIERDLHDGAQARLVAMGMHLGAVEHLMERDPEQARALLAEVRAASAEALHELRDLVRGIHPPVLAERGLGDAVRALALRHPAPVEVTVRVPGRLDAPVESAAYFAVSELLTNVAKHAGAGRVVVDLGHRDGLLRITVVDDGVGGADPAGGTGLRGVERRLAAFDGVLAVSSPPGGPTAVTLEIPCVPVGSGAAGNPADKADLS